MQLIVVGQQQEVTPCSSLILLLTFRENGLYFDDVNIFFWFGAILPTSNICFSHSDHQQCQLANMLMEVCEPHCTTMIQEVDMI